MDQFNPDEGDGGIFLGDVPLLIDSDVDSGGPASDRSEFTNESISEGEELDWVTTDINNDMQSGDITKLKRRYKALMNNQLELLNLRGQQAKELHELEVKYQGLAAPIINARLAIIQGTHEPTDEECDLSRLEWVPKMAVSNVRILQPKQSEEYDALNESLQNMDIGETKKGDEETVTDGVPDFWSRVIAKSKIPQNFKDNCDYPILQHLVNVRLDMTLNPMGYSLYFDFSPNPYFTNATLRKTFLTSCEQKLFSPLKSIETPWVAAAVGCAIDWKPFKNVTTKTVLVKQRSAKGANKRYVMSEKEVTATSFFNFFKTVPEEGSTELENWREELEEHFDIGEYFRKDLIPRAFLFYTKRVKVDSESEDEDLDEEEEETESEQETNENDENMMGYGKRFRNGVIVDLREKLNQKRNLQQQNIE